MASNNLTALIKHYESLHDGDLKKIGFQPKLCPAGYWTIGYGHAVILNGKIADYTVPYSKVEALTLFDEEVASDLLSRDLSVYTTQVLHHITKPHLLSQNQIDAIVSLSYNIGIGNFETSTLLKRLNKGDLKGASLEFPKWRMARNPKTNKDEIMPGLVARRQSEQWLFLNNELKFFN
jgi:lysozyme